jgi:RNA polymerase sigma factor for flagellar operon FliA
VPLEECVVRDRNGKTFCLLDKIEDTSVASPVEKLEEEEMCKILQEEIDCLSEKERLIIVLYYYEDLTLKEIGHILNLSESRISQIHSKILSDFKNKLEEVDTLDSEDSYSEYQEEKERNFTTFSRR